MLFCCCWDVPLDWAVLLLCIVAGAARLSGQYYMGNYQLTTLLQAGIAAVVMGCFFLLLALTARERKD
jgi:hypothetical protein